MRKRFVEGFRGGKQGRGRYYWRQVGGNGEITAQSEAYTARAACERAAKKTNPGLDFVWIIGPAKARKLSPRLAHELRFYALDL